MEAIRSEISGIVTSLSLLRYSLGRLEVSVDDFVEVEVVHATCNAHGPVNHEGGGDFAARPQHLIQLPLGTVFHQDTVTRSLGAHAPVEGGEARQSDDTMNIKGKHERFMQDIVRFLT